MFVDSQNQNNISPQLREALQIVENRRNQLQKMMPIKRKGGGGKRNSPLILGLRSCQREKPEPTESEHPSRGLVFAWEVSCVSRHHNCPALPCGVEDHASGKEELRHQDQKSFVMGSGHQDVYNVCSSRNLRPKISDAVNSCPAAMKHMQSRVRGAEQEWRS